MYIHGSFANIYGDIITVYILTRKDRSEEIVIGNEGEATSILFTIDPVEIKQEVNDTFDVLLPTSVTINLLTRQFVPDLFQPTCFDAAVNIYRGDKCMFAGFIEPMSYSQPYSDALDELSLNCIDVLSALQYVNYGRVGAPGVNYEGLKAVAGQRTFDSIIKELISRAVSELDILGKNQVSLNYDGSKAIDSSAQNHYKVLSQLSISELLFFGEDEDKVWTADTVLTEMLKYLNLHIRQAGFDFYVFSWENIKAGNTAYVDIFSGRSDQDSTRVHTLSLKNVYGTDAQISVGEVYNQISLTCEVSSTEDVIESPLDGGKLKSPFSNKQLYMTEYSSDGEGETARQAFGDMVRGIYTDWEHAVITDWFAQIRHNPRWRFRIGGKDVSKYYTNTNQQLLLNDLGRQPGAAIISFGKVETKARKNDNAPVSRVSMSDYLVMSVNGNGNDTETGTFPTEGSLKAGIPYAEYDGGISGGVFSPSDDDTTNYIVISGKIVLNPVMELTCSYNHARQLFEGRSAYEAWLQIMMDHGGNNGTVPSRDNGDGRYYTRRYYKAATPLSEPVADDISDSWYPFTGTGPEQYEFKYSAVGDGADRISKVGIIACQLIIGDKCAVEVDNNGGIEAIQWKPYKEREQCSSDDEYFQQSFTIGFNPKIGDKLIGTEFDIQNNISYTKGIDADGTAIRVSRPDKLSGPVKFRILGPVNLLWSDVTRRHPTAFRHTKWTSTSIPLLAHVSSILIKNFEIKVYSDNGLVNNFEDKDIVYTSDTDERYVNRKDDIEFKISSALTTAERQTVGVADVINMGTPQNTITKDPVTDLYDYTKRGRVKPEKSYVDSYYKEYHSPRLILENSVFDSEENVDVNDHYIHPALSGKVFFVQAIEKHLQEGSARLTLKEIEN